MVPRKSAPLYFGGLAEMSSGQREVWKNKKTLGRKQYMESTHNESLLCIHL